MEASQAAPILRVSLDGSTTPFPEAIDAAGFGVRVCSFLDNAVNKRCSVIQPVAVPSSSIVQVPCTSLVMGISVPRPPPPAGYIASQTWQAVGAQTLNSNVGMVDSPQLSIIVIPLIEFMTGKSEYLIAASFPSWFAKWVIEMDLLHSQVQKTGRLELRNNRRQSSGE